MKFQNSVILLIGTNLLPFAGVYFWGWNVMDILFLYWAETAILAFFSLLKTLFARDDESGLKLVISKIMRVISLPVFLVYYGGFIAGLGLVLYYLNKEIIGQHMEVYELLYSTRYVLFSFIFSYCYSFIADYMVRDKRRIARDNDPVFEIYRRILVLFFTISFGMGLTIFLGEPLYMLVALIIFKIAIDLFVNYIKKARFGEKLISRVKQIFQRMT